MDNQDKLIDDVEVIAKKIKELHDLAYVRYSRLVDAVLTDSLTDEKQIEHILDGILDFGDDLRFLELSKKLCRHIYYRYPHLVGSFVNMYRMLFEENEDSDGNGDNGLTLNMQKKVLLILRYSATSEKRTFRSSLQLSKISKKA